jgi:malic enzyme
MFIFPGVGLGAVVSGATTITDQMFYNAALALANTVTDQQLENGEVSHHSEDAVLFTAHHRDGCVVSMESLSA